MRRCSKCLAEYADGSRICRSCGGILDEVDELPATATFEPLPATAHFEPTPVEPPPEAWLPEDAHPVLQRPTGDWTCPRCGERVPATFDVCWKCDAEGQRVGEVPARATTLPPAPPAYPKRQCAACGSGRMIVGAEIADTGQHSEGTLAVIVDANPQALIFKNRLRGDLVADVCGDCGHVELRVHNCGELYAHYRSAQE